MYRQPNWRVLYYQARKKVAELEDDLRQIIAAHKRIAVLEKLHALLTDTPTEAKNG